MPYSSTDLGNTTTTNKLAPIGRIVSPRPKWQQSYYLTKKHRMWNIFTASQRSDAESEPEEKQLAGVKVIHPEFRSFWMFQDRYMVTAMRTYLGYQYTISIYEEGEMETSGELYGNDY